MDDEFMRFLHGEDPDDEPPIDNAVTDEDAPSVPDETADEVLDETADETPVETADETPDEIVTTTTEESDDGKVRIVTREIIRETVRETVHTSLTGSAEEPARAEISQEEDEEEQKEADEAQEEQDEEAESGEKTEERAISSDLIRGHINTIILRSLYDGDKYGYEIIAEIERKSHDQYTLKQPSLYSALKRLEKDGYVTSYWGGSVGGGRRKYFSLTDAGKEIAERNQTEWEYSRTVIDSLISDRAFDFNQPAPSAVDMRVLKKSTSRVPERENEEGEFEYDEPTSENAEALAAERAAFEAERERYEESLKVREEVLRAREEAGTKREQELLQREFALAAEEEHRSQLEEVRREELQQAESEAQQKLEEVERQRQEELAAHLAEREQFQQQLQAEVERARAQALWESKEAQNARIAEIEPFVEERARYEQLLRDQAEQMETRHRHELAMQEARLRREAEEDLHRREQELMHRNFLNLVNTPPPAVPEGPYYEQPRPATPYAAKPEAEREYRTVIRRLYENANPAPAEEEPQSAPLPEPEEAAPAPVTAPAPEPAAPAAAPSPRTVRTPGGADFYDLEMRAAQDGIRITLSNGSRKEVVKERSESLVHRGKALFLSAIVVFLLLLAEGSLALGFQSRLSLPRFYPFFIWGSGLALFLVTGVLFLNHYGERSLRRTGNLLVNTIVAYALCVILILIVALAARIDFANAGELATFVIFPAVYFFSIVVFGIAYYVQIRPIGE